MDKNIGIKLKNFTKLKYILSMNISGYVSKMVTKRN